VKPASRALSVDIAARPANTTASFAEEVERENAQKVTFLADRNMPAKHNRIWTDRRTQDCLHYAQRSDSGVSINDSFCAPIFWSFV